MADENKLTFQDYLRFIGKILFFLAILFLFIKFFGFWTTVLIALFFLVLILGLGAFRLFFLGRNETCEATLTDISKLRKGDILLVGSHGVTWKTIFIQFSNVLTRKPKHRFWNHAAIYAGDGMVWEAEPAGGDGINKNSIDKYLKEGCYLRVFRHKYLNDEEVLDKILKFCSDKDKGYKYGLGAACFYGFSTLIPVTLNCVFNDPVLDKMLHLDNAYFCSELVVDAYAEAGYPISIFDGWRVKPADFIGNPLLEDV